MTNPMKKTAMRLSTTCLAVVAAGCFGVVGLSALTQSANGAAKPQEQDQTFQMYANVDAEGDLGSNHDAVHVSLDSDQRIYTVKFGHEISHCAASAQAGRAGGSDPVKTASSVVAQAGKKALIIRFADVNGNVIDEPFMVTVTCTK